jgi:hypothetical protein
VNCGGNLQGSGGVPTGAIQQHQAMLVGKAGAVCQRREASNCPALRRR